MLDLKSLDLLIGLLIPSSALLITLDNGEKIMLLLRFIFIESTTSLKLTKARGLLSELLFQFQMNLATPALCLLQPLSVTATCR